MINRHRKLLLHDAGCHLHLEKHHMSSTSFSRSTALALVPLAFTLILAAWLFCAPAPMHAQLALAVTDATSTPQPGSGHDYVHGLNETVNPATGSLSLRFNIPLRKGRGVSLPLSIDYDSNGLAAVQDSLYGPTVYNTIAPCDSNDGWSYTLPCLTAKHTSLSVPISPSEFETCYWNDNFVFYDPTGGKHALNLLAAYASNVTGTDCPQTTGSSITGGDVYYRASTGSDSSTFKQTQVADSDGTTYTFSPAFVSTVQYDSNTTFYTAYPVSIEDRNGNQITRSNGNYIDTLGSSSALVNDSGIFYGSGTDTITVAGIATAYKIAWESPITRNYDLNFTLETTGDVNCAPVGPTHMGGQIARVQSITLPNNETYTFTYDQTYGAVNKITYPNNWSVSYDWDIIPYFTSGLFRFTRNTDIWQSNVPYTSYCAYNYDVVGIKGRHVFQGTTEVLTQTFAYTSPTSYGGPTTTTITTKDNLRHNSTTTTITYNKNFVPANGYASPINDGPVPEYTPGYVSMESTESVSDYSGSLLQTTSKSWYPSTTWYNMNLLQSEKVTLGTNGPTSQTDYCYNSGGTIAEKDEYDYGATLPATPTCPQTAPLPTRSTITAYQSFAATNAYPAGPSIFDRPWSVITNDSTGTPTAKTIYTYDGSVVTTASAIQHDEGNYGSGSTFPRGNATSVTRCLSTACPNTEPTTQYTYDETGQVSSMTDPRGNTTSYSYTDSPSGGDPAGNSNAYLTQATSPVVNGSTLYEYFSHNYTTGELSSSKDVNGNTTTYAYNDPLNRLTQTTYPDGGQTTISYNDSVPSITTSTLMNATSGESMTSVATLDGMGRVIQTQLTTDPEGADIVDTTYDGAGRVYTKSNPYRTGQGGGTTTYDYDALGRQIEEVEQDGTILQWCYNGTASLPAVANCGPQMGSVTGSWVDFTDPKGNHWQRTSDSFGRLTEVMEPNGTTQSPSMETDYSYNALNDLISVAQWGGAKGSSGARVRSFVYDSLSRLQTAANPETGTVGYAYDANGNVHTRTDARGVTTSYIYDALNRLLSKTYSDSATSSSCYQYDSSSVVNGIGRLANEWTQSTSAGACSATGPFLTKRSFLVYDAMGRIRNERQYTLANQTAGAAYAPAYTYDLAGNLLTSTDGTTPTPTTPGATLTFTSTFSGAGRLLTMSSNWADATHPATLFSLPTGQQTPCSTPLTVQYAASGQLVNAAFGNGLFLNRGYDLRLRMNCEVDTGNIVTTPTSGYAAVTVTGAEQSK